MAFAGYPSFASLALPSTLPLSLLCALRGWSLCTTSTSMSCPLVALVSGNHEQETWGLKERQRLWYLFPWLLSSDSWSVVCDCIQLHALQLFEFWDSFFLFTSSAYGWQCLSFVASFKVIYFLILLSLTVTSNGRRLDFLFVFLFLLHSPASASPRYFSRST